MFDSQEGFEAEDDIGARDDYTREVDEEAAFQKAQVNGMCLGAALASNLRHACAVVQPCYWCGVLHASQDRRSAAT
jgi:hypothetical protein